MQEAGKMHNGTMLQGIMRCCIHYMHRDSGCYQASNVSANRGEEENSGHQIEQIEFPS